eukprot:scaffold7369_cov61-Phaeocystis_antarctica.AAC.2
MNQDGGTRGTSAAVSRSQTGCGLLGRRPMSRAAWYSHGHRASYSQDSASLKVQMSETAIASTRRFPSICARTRTGSTIAT